MLPRRVKDLVRLIDANPKWVDYGYEKGKPMRRKVAISFDCPIHENCRIAVPLKNPLDGGPPITSWFPSGAVWHHVGEFADMTISPSIHVLGEPDDCEWHGFVKDGRFETCGDSK